VLLVEKGFFASREQAARAVRAGWVSVEDRRVDKPGKTFSGDSRIKLRRRPRYVSRGGDKLEGALVDLRLDASGLIALDAGASTGGFTDCLLQHGAARVYSCDVGFGQLAWKLRCDPRVEVRERCNVRYLGPDDFPEKVDLIVADLSFISLTKVLPALFPLLSDDGRFLVLVKPQFEAGREQVGKGGVVRSEEIRRETVEKVTEAIRTGGHSILGIVASRLRGPAGNVEFFVLSRRGK